MGKTTTYNNVAGLNRAFRSLPKLVSAELRDEAGSIAGDVATHAASRARSQPGVAKYVAPTIKVRRDRVPVIRMGGNGRLPNGGVVGDVWGGAEFGSKRHAQFQPFKRSGYFLYATVRDMNHEIMQRYDRALYDALQKVR